MEFKNLHPWDVNYKEAVQIQQRLQKKLILKKPKSGFRLVAGTDVAYDKKSDKVFAGVVILNLENMQRVEQATAVGRVRFPYIPGLLSFRESPILLKAFSKIKQTPDIIIVDGQGIAHPRGIGLASHLGLILDMPSVGCAKSRLVGEHEPVGKKAGSQSYIKINGKVVGVVLRTKTNIKPVYVSPGHKIDLASVVNVVLKCCRGYKLPEPTRQAHNLVNKLRRRL
ncbi:MAG TPA: deoxyribonuclease V [Candidatus Brocadiia bacterium]|nr:deoxyribonuclease V [Planctomycetota bacterium]MBI4008546.1 deoxyribonuclease V [Planctomycetota bacterium]MDO8094227.1 deoxyribonuclease V [Candidatus Brocadiales bacterium]